MKRKWTRGEKWLWATPVLVGVFAAAVMWGPTLARRAVGLPQVWTTTPETYIRSMALSANGEILAAAGMRDKRDNKNFYLSGSGTIYLWNARTGERLESIAPVYNRVGSGGWDVYALKISPDARQIGFSRVGEKKWTLYDLATRKPLWRFNKLIEDAEFSPDGRFIALSVDGVVTIVNASDGRTRTQWTHKADVWSPDIAWSPDNRWVANINLGDVVELHQASDGKLVRRFHTPYALSDKKVMSMAFSPDGRRLVTACLRFTNSINSDDDYTKVAPLHCYDTTTGKLLWEIKTPALGKADKMHASFCDAVFSPDGRTIAAYQQQVGQVFLIGSATGAILSERKLDRANSTNFHVPPGLLFAPDGKRLFVRGKNAVVVMDLN